MLQVLPSRLISSTVKRPNDYTDEEIAQAIIDCKGYIKAVAARLDVKTDRLRYKILHSPELRELMFEQSELVSDNAELYLIEAVEGRKPWAIKLWLTRQARHRGWGQKLEVEAKVDSDSRVVVYLPDDGREAKGDDNGDSTAAGTAGHSAPQ